MQETTTHILFVDDNKELVEEFTELFEDYRVTPAYSAAAALNILSNPNDISLILLDHKLPDVRGTELLTEIRARYPEIGVIMVTAHASTDNVIDALRGHADDFICKPFHAEELRRRIENVCKSKKSGLIDQENTSHYKLSRIKDFILRNHRKKITLNQVAQHVCMSPKYLSRLFKEETQRGFAEYKISLRIDDAKRLLTTTSLNVEQIANKVGYDNVEAFIKQFKKFTNVNPAQYRAENRR